DCSSCEFSVLGAVSSDEPGVSDCIPDSPFKGEVSPLLVPVDLLPPCENPGFRRVPVVPFEPDALRTPI
ncbi:MAG: hypothetical protein WCC31_08060, partial [Terracidiphilus sp.]